MKRKGAVVKAFGHHVRSALLVIGGTFCIHLLVLAVDLLFAADIQLNLQSNFLGAVFASPMVPVALAYAVLLSGMMYLWSRTRQAMEQAHRYEMELAKQRAVREAIQGLTVDLSERIAVHNAEILKWVGLQKLRGRQVSERVESASLAIAASLSDLSETAFVTAYNEPERMLHELSRK